MLKFRFLILGFYCIFNGNRKMVVLLEESYEIDIGR